MTWKMLRQIRPKEILYLKMVSVFSIIDKNRVFTYMGCVNISYTWILLGWVDFFCHKIYALRLHLVDFTKSG